MQRQQYLGLLDMLDGGGPGRAGSTFEGGPLSGLLNLLGIRPMGYADRMAQAPTASPMAPAPMGGGMAPPAPRRALAAPRMMAPALTGPAGGPRPELRGRPAIAGLDYMPPGLTASAPMPQITRTGDPRPAIAGMDYMPPGLTASAPMPQVTSAGADPTRDPEFAKWFTGRTGVDVVMVHPPTLRAVYDEWLAARMGAR